MAPLLCPSGCRGRRCTLCTDTHEHRSVFDFVRLGVQWCWRGAAELLLLARGHTESWGHVLATIHVLGNECYCDVPLCRG